MDTSTHVLIVGGMSVLAVGLLLGIPMAMARSKASHAPRYLLVAHLAAIIQGTLLLALTVPLGVTTLSAGVKTLAASVLVAGVVLFDLANILNWLQGVQDAFAERSLGNKIGPVGTFLVLIGAGIVFYGVLIL